jgi:thiol:disulfide interchange protein DsbD
MKIYLHILLSASLIAAGSASGDTGFTPPKSHGLQEANKTHDDFLPVDEAFDLTAKPKDSSSVGLTWIIAPRYYLYRGKVTVSSETPGVQVGAVELPKGQLKHDEYFGDTQVYYEVLDARVPIKSAVKKVSLRVTYQGCAEEGLCYNPVTKTVTVNLP